MKKTFLTFVAVGFGFSVAFAQTTEPVDAVEQPEVQEEVMPAEEDALLAEPARVVVEMAAVPVVVQDAFKNGQYSDMEVVTIYEVAPAEGDAAALTVYEFELAQDAAAPANTEMEGVETEQLSNTQPDLILLYDENGQLLEEKNADEIEE